MKRFFVSVLVLAFMNSFLSVGFADTDTQEEIRALKEQVQELMKRIEQLESQQVKVKQEQETIKTQVAQAPQRVDLDKITSMLKLKGRWAAGYYWSGKSGAYPSGSWEAPEAKIQFTFTPDKINTIVMRMNLNNATFNNLDYFYLDSKDFIPWLKDKPFTLSSRIGRFKLDFGEETWANNPVESVLPSNSAANVAGSDEGVQLSGKIGKKLPVNYAFSVTNGNSGTGSDSGKAKALAAKLSVTPVTPLYLSASYYDSGDLKISNSEMSIAGLASRPGTSTNWERRLWEVDGRYDFKKGKTPLNPPAYSDSKAILRLAYGQFSDRKVAAGTERSGDYGFVEGTYNINKRLYTAGRLSFVDLDGDTTATLNSVANANRYVRYSFGFGWRWSPATIIKFGYDINHNSGGSNQEAEDNLFSAIVASQF